MRRLAIYILMVFAIRLGADAHKLIDSLISEGNRAYELGQVDKIKACADSIDFILNAGGMGNNNLIDYKAALLKLRGNQYYEDDQFYMADYCYREAQNLIDRNSGVDFHGLDLLLPRERAQLHYRLGEYDQAEELLKTADDIIEYGGRYRVGDDNYLTHKLSYALTMARNRKIDEALEMAAGELAKALDRNSRAYTNAERMYAKILLLADVDKEGALTAYKRYFDKQKKFAMANFADMNAIEREQFWHQLRPFIADCYLLEEADPGFLYDVALFSKGLLLELLQRSGNGKASKKALKSLNYRWTDIQKKLKRGQAAAEFIAYEKDSEAEMAVVIVYPEGKPKFIKLTRPAAVLEEAGEGLETTEIYDKDYIYESESVNDLVWTKPLIQSLEGVDRLYFAPDGYIHRLAIEYLQGAAEREVYRLTSTRRLMEPPRSVRAEKPMLLVGDINYNAWLDLSATDNDQRAFSSYQGTFFPILAAQFDETSTILEDRNNKLDRRMALQYASEAAFRTEAPDYESIIVSTHGCFRGRTPMATDIKPTATDDCLSQNIIAFAGVNPNLGNSSLDPYTMADGLLSAREIRDLDLRRCRLFTVAACQSALGVITSDGVFGIQRALKNAGVDAMLLSLWTVESDATSRLMRLFYANLAEGMTPRRAFAAARKALIDVTLPDQTVYVFDPATLSYKETTENLHPFEAPARSNAFILIDALE